MANIEIIIISVIGAISSLLTMVCIALKNSRIKHLSIARCISVNQDSEKSSVSVTIGSHEACRKELVNL
jgi:3,4-dihydroxy-2-butanone 4-phosphate synthase